MRFSGVRHNGEVDRRGAALGDSLQGQETVRGNPVIWSQSNSLLQVTDLQNIFRFSVAALRQLVIDISILTLTGTRGGHLQIYLSQPRPLNKALLWLVSCY